MALSEKSQNEKSEFLKKTVLSETSFGTLGMKSIQSKGVV